MSAISNVLQQFVQRRLWPVAILLVAAVAAVPVLLAKDPAPAPAAPPATADTGTDVLASQPIVAEATSSDRAKRRKVLGKPKNPFAVEKTTTASDTPPSSDGTATANDPATPSSAPTGGSSAPGVIVPIGGTPVTPVPGTPAAPHKSYAPGSLTVRFSEGDSSGRKTVDKLEALPNAEAPVLIYLGLSRDGKSAIFLVDEGVEAVGDGDCDPAPDKCETVELKVGETEFLDVKDENGNVTAQYQLDLLKIHGASASAARASRTRATRAKAARILKGVATGGSVRGTTSLRAVTGL